jgi:hypothetical protein
VKRAALAGALAVAALAPCGCGLATLTFDSTIGPLTPAPPLHDLTVGEEFHVTETGPEGTLGDNALLRPYPRDMIRRLSSPSSFWAATQGIEAFLTSISPIANRTAQVGGSTPTEMPPELQPGVALASALALLGPPDLWLRRESGSLLLYRDASRRVWSFYVGVPPPAALLVPIPFISSLRFRYISERERAQKLMLFFDADDALLEARLGVDSDAEVQ